jgi:hypothetical protein
MQKDLVVLERDQVLGLLCDSRMVGSKQEGERLPVGVEMEAGLGLFVSSASDTYDIGVRSELSRGFRYSGEEQRQPEQCDFH